MKIKRVREGKSRRSVSGGKPYSFIHSLIKCVLRTYYVPSTVLNSVNVKWNKTWSLLQRCLKLNKKLCYWSLGVLEA